MPPIATLRDNFSDNLTATAWDAATVGSATVAETSGQARFTLPSSTAGSHVARYTSNTQYDLTGGSFFITIDTMVATGVAATAFFQIYLDGANTLQWIQVSGTLYARTIIAGVSTDRYSAAWSGTTYKYLRIRESAGNIEWHSSTNGTSWTLRATLAIPFAITALSVDVGATCGNIAAPGSFRLEDVNLILPALTTTWRWTQVVWPLTNRYKTITLALDTAGTAQAYVVTSDAVDVSGNPTAPVRYWSGPADGGRLLTEQTSQAAAEDMAVDIPVDGRFDLPELIEARCIRVYHRSIDGSAYTIRELYPRRLVQADDIEAESIRAIHIAAASITADRLSVTDLSSITANIGQLTITKAVGDAWIYQGTGTGDAPTTGLKIYNSAGIGKLSTYKAGVEQITIDTDGALKWAAGGGLLDADGLRIAVGTTSAYGYLQPLAITFEHTDGNVGRIFGTRVAAGQRTFAIQGDQGSSTDDVEIGIQVDATGGSAKEAIVRLDAQNSAGLASIIVQSLSATSITLSADTALVNGALNVGTGAGTTAGGIRGTISDTGTTNTAANLYLGHNTSNTPAAGFGTDIVVTLETTTTPDTLASIIRTSWSAATHASRKATVEHYVYDTGPRLALEIEASGTAAMIGFLGATPVVRQTVAAAAAAGGTGATAGAYDTAAHRDGLITLVNNIRSAGIALGLWA
jgi:hypothetical protein